MFQKTFNIKAVSIIESIVLCIYVFCVCVYMCVCVYIYIYKKNYIYKIPHDKKK